MLNDDFGWNRYLIVDSYIEGAGPDIFCLLGNSTVRNSTIFNRDGGNCIYYAGFLTFDGCNFSSTRGLLFGNTGGNHVLRVGNGTRVHKSVLNLAAIQRPNPGCASTMPQRITRCCRILYSA